ncbi:MAG: PAS domain S-box protein [Sphingomonadaceae bacterium]
MNSLTSRITVALLALLLVGLGALSMTALSMLRSDLETMLGQQQFSTVRMAADAIGVALQQRIDALAQLGASLPSAPAARRAALHAHSGASGRYLGLQLLGADGTVLASNGIDGVDPALRQAVLADGRPRIGRAGGGARAGQPEQIRFVLTIALPGADGGRTATLTAVSALEREGFLAPYSLRAYGQTGGYMLVAPGERLVLAATSGRIGSAALPAPGSNALVERFVAGYEGSGTARNLQGVEVLASAKRIGLANWYLAAALPTQEAYAPVAAMQQRLLLAAATLLLLVGALAWWTLRQQLAPVQRALRALGRINAGSAVPQPLPNSGRHEIGALIDAFNQLLATASQREAALQQSERTLFDILEHADGYVYLKDRAGRYLFANRPVRTLFGRSMADIIGHDDSLFFDAATVAALQRTEAPVWEQGQTVRTEETTHNQHGVAAIYQSVKLPLRDQAGTIYAMCGISHDITERRAAEAALRIAAISFESVAAIVILDARLRILRANQAFSRITGYLPGTLDGRRITLLDAAQPGQPSYRSLWRSLRRHGAWQGSLWQRRRDGSLFYASGSLTAVHDESGQVSHYVCHLLDATDDARREQQRRRDELAQREALVREVHHRIKNNLQGITGIQRQCAAQHPDTAAPIQTAIDQVQSISVIHGLRGRARSASVRLCELTQAICEQVAQSRQTPVRFVMPTPWQAWHVAENEAVPLALVLNELIVNAAKHGGAAHDGVDVRLAPGQQPDSVCVTIRNHGQLGNDYRHKGPPHNGLDLVSALMPPAGAHLDFRQEHDTVIIALECEPPIISRTDPDLPPPP